MGGGKIADVDVVPDARSVRSWKICSVNLSIRQRTERYLQNTRNQMRLNPMMFPISFRSAGNIKIAENTKSQPMNLIKPAQDFFEQDLRFTVRIDRVLRRFFIDRYLIRRAEGCASGGKHE